jgi:LPS export ABC transporter protein LptC
MTLYKLERNNGMPMFSRWLSACILVVLILSACQEQPKSKPAAVEPDIPIHTIWGFSMILMDSSKTKAIVNSAIAVVNDRRLETLLDSAVRVEFMNASSERVGLLTADSAKIDDRTRNMFAYGRVKVVSDSTRTTLTSTMLMWNNDRQILFTPEKVHIVTPTEVIDGTGLESDQYLKNYKIFRVSGIKKAE